MKTRYKIRLGFFAILMLTTLWFTSPHYFPALIASVAIHEAGHLFMAKACNIPIQELQLDIFGASITPINIFYSYKKEILLCLGGPLSNFFSVIIIFFIPCVSQTLQNFMVSSFALGLINMLPIIGFDGGRIFSDIMNMIIQPHVTYKIMKAISFIFIFSLWCFSVYLMLKVTASLTMFVFSASLFAKILLPQTT